MLLLNTIQLFVDRMWRLGVCYWQFSKLGVWIVIKLSVGNEFHGVRGVFGERKINWIYI